MNKRASIYLILLAFILSLSCEFFPERREPQPPVLLPTPTRTQTATLTFSPTVSPSPTIRLTSTSKPPEPATPSSTPEPIASETPELLPSPTTIPESEILLQQAITMPDGTLRVTHGNVDIVGTDVFLYQTLEGMSLLQNKSPEAYTKIQTYIGLIELGEHSGMWAFENPPRYEVGQRTADSTTTWYASTIAHDAVHSELYHEYLNQHGPPVPDDAWASVEAEQFCIAFQLNVLKDIGAPDYEIEYLESQTGTHCDVDNDGDCDWDDYDNRDW
jgi:hypothetical protein